MKTAHIYPENIIRTIDHLFNDPAGFSSISLSDVKLSLA